MSLVIKNLLYKLKANYRSEYQEHRELAKNRDWKNSGFSSPVRYMNDLESFSDEENTIWEQGYRRGLQDTIDIIEKEYLNQPQ